MGEINFRRDFSPRPKFGLRSKSRPNFPCTNVVGLKSQRNLTSPNVSVHLWKIYSPITEKRAKQNSFQSKLINRQFCLKICSFPAVSCTFEYLKLITYVIANFPQSVSGRILRMSEYLVPLWQNIGVPLFWLTASIQAWRKNAVAFAYLHSL